jgi:hypothetical protein
MKNWLSMKHLKMTLINSKKFSWRFNLEVQKVETNKQNILQHKVIIYQYISICCMFRQKKKMGEIIKFICLLTLFISLFLVVADITGKQFL